MKKFILLMVLGLAFAFQEKAFAVSEDQLTIGMAGEFENLNPAIAQQALTNYTLYFAWRRLVVLGLDYKWKPYLIKEIPTLENKLLKRKGKGLDVTFDIIDQAVWGDGVPITCADVDLTWKVGLNKNISIGERDMYEN